MTHPRRRFRIEGGPVEQGPRSGTGSSGPGSHPARAVERGSGLSRAQGPAEGRAPTDLSVLHDAIATTKRELDDLQHAPTGTAGMHRATGELAAVSSAAERATNAILGAVEEIELSANLLRTAGSGAAAGANVDLILDRVLVLYEACNFHDIAGQRLRSVVSTVQFVEERLHRVIAAWDETSAGGTDHRPSRRQARTPNLVGGPRLPGDEGHVTQADVDTFFL